MPTYLVRVWRRSYGYVEAATAAEAIDKFENDPGEYESGFDRSRNAVAKRADRPVKKVTA